MAKHVMAASIQSFNSAETLGYNLESCTFLLIMNWCVRANARYFLSIVNVCWMCLSRTWSSSPMTVNSKEWTSVRLDGSMCWSSRPDPSGCSSGCRWGENPPQLYKSRGCLCACRTPPSFDGSREIELVLLIYILDLNLIIAWCLQ